MLALLLMLFLAACGDTEEGTDNKKDDAPVEENENGASEEEGTEGTEGEEATDTEGEEATDSDEEKKEFNQVVVDNEHVKATLIRVERSYDDFLESEKVDITFEVENKRQDAIEVQAGSVSADGKMVDEMLLTMSQEVAAGKLADAVLTIQDWEGGELPPMEDNIELTLNVFSWDDFDFDIEVPVTIDMK